MFPLHGRKKTKKKEDCKSTHNEESLTPPINKKKKRAESSMYNLKINENEDNTGATKSDNCKVLQICADRGTVC